MILKRTYLASNLVSKLKITERVLKEAHGELDTQDPCNSIIYAVHGNDSLLNQIGDTIDELCVVVRNHDLEKKYRLV